MLCCAYVYASVCLSVCMYVCLSLSLSACLCVLPVFESACAVHARTAHAYAQRTRSVLACVLLARSYLPLHNQRRRNLVPNFEEKSNYFRINRRRRLACGRVFDGEAKGVVCFRFHA